MYIIHVYVIVLHIKIASLYTLNDSNAVLYGIAVVMCVYVCLYAWQLLEYFII